MKTCTNLFKNHLDAKNYKYTIEQTEDGIDVIIFPYKGKQALCFFAGDDGKYLSIYLNFEKVPEDKVADLIFLANELNCQYKWVKFYVDNSRNFMLQDDAILTHATASEEAFELLVRLFSIGDEIKNPVMKAIYA